MRLFHCDDSEAFRRLLELMLAEREGLELVGGAGDRESALQGVRATQPDVVLLDAIAPDFGTDLVDALTAVAPQARIVVLSGHPELRADHPRVRAVVAKDTPMDELQATLERVVARRP
jgi:DNA-binding NarL/FixJ family response regulator